MRLKIQMIVFKQRQIIGMAMRVEKTFSENTEKGILTTKYRVSVSKATMRSGPGTSYTSLGIYIKMILFGLDLLIKDGLSLKLITNGIIFLQNV